MKTRLANIDEQTVEGFGAEWTRFDQADLVDDEREQLFRGYFRIFDFDSLPAGATVFDAGCGSGRWARVVAPRVGRIHCIDASAEALSIARRNLAGRTNCVFHHASVSSMPLPDESMDFGYSLGVLHHIPDTLEGLRACVRKLKPHASFLLYLYYALDNRPAWFRALWRVSDLLRALIARLPLPFRHVACDVIAAVVYLPLARTARAVERAGIACHGIPLAEYRYRSFYSMRTDALDRFGTRLERRFTRSQIEELMRQAGLEEIVFSEEPPYWCALGRRSASLPLQGEAGGS